MTPRIQGIYVLMNPATLAPAALIDGPALTCLRTPAVSIAAVRRLARPDSSRLVVFGAGLRPSATFWQSVLNAR